MDDSKENTQARGRRRRHNANGACSLRLVFDMRVRHKYLGTHDGGVHSHVRSTEIPTKVPARY